jgi:choline dehydrogenase-like flavoprotein
MAQPEVGAPAGQADAEDVTLLENAHPPAWRNPQPAGRYDFVILGAGPAGLLAARGAATLGRKVALIERDLLGGNCLNVGCVPSKALISTSRLYARMRAAQELGVSRPESKRASAAPTRQPACVSTASMYFSARRALPERRRSRSRALCFALRKRSLRRARDR